MATFIEENCLFFDPEIPPISQEEYKKIYQVFSNKYAVKKRNIQICSKQ